MFNYCMLKSCIYVCIYIYIYCLYIIIKYIYIYIHGEMFPCQAKLQEVTVDMSETHHYPQATA